MPDNAANDRNRSWPARARPSTRLRIGLIGSALGIVVGLGIMAFVALDSTPSAQRYRDRGIQIVRGELAELPAPAGSMFGGEQVSNAPGRPLGIIAFYSPIPRGGCPALQSYYDPMLRNAGWSGGQPSGTKGVDVTYTKTVAEYHLHLDLTCDSDGSYTVGIDDEKVLFRGLVDQVGYEASWATTSRR